MVYVGVVEALEARMLFWQRREPFRETFRETFRAPLYSGCINSLMYSSRIHIVPW